MSEAQRALLKQQYGWLYQELIKLLGEVDLMGFVSTGMPADEYDIEVDELLLRLPEASSPNQLGQIIYEVFVKCFDIAFAPANEPEPSTEHSKQLFAAMGAEVWILWLRWRRETLKQQYGGLHEALVKLLADEDPMRLIKTGAPIDEYELEVDHILLRLPGVDSPSALGPIIYDIFVQCFGESFSIVGKPYSGVTKEHYEAIGEKAWTLWLRWQAETQQN